MIDVENEELLTLTEAARSLPGQPSACSIWRWRTRGIAGVKLEVVCVGGRTYTSREKLALFMERVTAAKSSQPVPSRMSRQHKREQQEALAGLSRDGLL